MISYILKSEVTYHTHTVLSLKTKSVVFFLTENIQTKQCTRTHWLHLEIIYGWKVHFNDVQALNVSDVQQWVKYRIVLGASICNVLNDGITGWRKRVVRRHRVCRCWTVDDVSLDVIISETYQWHYHPQLLYRHARHHRLYSRTYIWWKAPLKNTEVKWAYNS